MTLTRMIKKRSVLFAKTETTSGTDVTPTEGANAIRVIDADIKEVIEKVERPVGQKFLGNIPSVAGTKHYELTFKVEVAGSGTVNLATRHAPLLLACSMDETINSGTDITYEPISGETTVYSCTIWLYIDGRVYKPTGCIGSVKLICEAGKIAIYEFTMKGKYVASSALSLPSPTYDANIPPTCKAGTFTYDSKTTLVVGKLEIDLGNVIATRFDVADATGIAGFVITDRKPMLTMNPEAQVETSYTFRTDQLVNQDQLSYVIGGTSKNIMTVTVPKVNIENIDLGDNEGVLLEEITAEIDISSGDDEIAIVYT